MSLNTLLLLYQSILYIFVFIFGICIGSFLNVCIYRIPNHLSIAKGRSFCPKCNHQLQALDLVPLFSYLFLGRKCRYCKDPISPRYFTVELLTGILFLLVFHVYGYTLQALLTMILVAILIVIAFIDYDTMDIYDYNHVLILILGLIRLVFINDLSLTSHLVGALIISLPLYLIYVLTKGIGGGDIKLMASVGFFLGFSNTIIAFLIGTISASIIAIYYLITKQKAKKDMIAFGPYLVIGIITALLYGNQLLNWYINLWR